MAFTKITNTNLSANVTSSFVTTAALENYATTSALANSLSNYATTSALTEITTSLSPKVTSVAVANSAFTTLDDTAVGLDGGYIVITGANFATGVTVLIDTTAATSVARVNSTTLRVQVPAKSAASYNLFVINPDGGTSIKVNGITYSANPNWVTSSPLDPTNSGTAFGVNLNATSATSYSVAPGSTLPAGTELLANGYFYGTASPEIETTYSFDVVATDDENQDSSKTFALTVTVSPPRLLYALGELGQGATAGYNGTHYGTFTTPTQIVTTDDWSDVTISDNSVFGVKRDGTLWAWGKNGNGQLGLDFLSDESGPPYGVSSPTQVGTDTNWYKCFPNGPSAGNRNVFAIKTDGTLWAWGNNAYNGGSNLGINVLYVRRSSPVQVGTDTWSDVLSLKNSTLAIKTDGTLWAWGTNSYAVLGLNLSTEFTLSSPVQVGALTNWSKFFQNSSNGTNSGRATRAIKTNGTLWTIGGYGGVINQNWFSVKSSPVQYGTDTDWASGSVNDSLAAIAIKTDGTMWALGGPGNSGQLGINSTVFRSSPVQIGTGTDWSKVFGAIESFHAIKTDGTLWAWGSSYDYKGNNSYGSNHTSSPTQVGSDTGWVSVHSSGIQGILTRDQ